MEAEQVVYPKDYVGQISVTATKEEWEQVVLDLFSLVGYEPLEPASHNLVRMLREQGVR